MRPARNAIFDSVYFTILQKHFSIFVADEMDPTPRAQWLPDTVEDMVDIVLEYEDLKDTLLVRPTNKPTLRQYLFIKTELKKR